MGVRIGCGLSTLPDSGDAAHEAASTAAQALHPGGADLVLVFASGAHLAAPDRLLPAIGDVLEPAALSGCGAAGVVGAGHEVEGGSAVVVWAAQLDGGLAETFQADLLQTDRGVALAGLPDPEDAAGLLLFPDPYSLPTDALLRALQDAAPSTAILGGLPSARTLDGDAALFCDHTVSGSGVCGVVLRDVDVEACVSQGAVPLGPELTITAAEGHVIHELAGQPALDRIRSVLLSLPAAQRDLIADGLMLGIVVDTGQPEYGPGDFLVRGVLGADPGTGAITVGAPVEPGQVVRLHTRDRITAGADLDRSLRAAGTVPAAGALVFTCQSRGNGFFGVPDHDAVAVDRALGGAPAAGFHASGEIGPLHGRPFLHGFTATVAVFRP